MWPLCLLASLASGSSLGGSCWVLTAWEPRGGWRISVWGCHAALLSSSLLAGWMVGGWLLLLARGRSGTCVSSGGGRAARAGAPVGGPGWPCNVLGTALRGAPVSCPIGFALAPVAPWGRGRCSA